MKQILIHSDQKTKDLGDLYGLFFEDINHAADGGLYAELVQNRGFEFCQVDNKDYDALTAWGKSKGLAWEVCAEGSACENNPHFLKAEGKYGDYFYNRGFGTGICVKAGESYIGTIRAKAVGSNTKIIMLISDAKDKSYSIISNIEKQEITAGDFALYEFKLKALETTKEGRLVVGFATEGVVDFDTISLFPDKTFMDRKNGLRPDLAQALKAMKPRFLRFPGGCLVHDGNLDASARNSMYRWKNTVGPVFDRPARRNNWGYNQTLGLGYYEYFCLCEDLETEPLPVLPAGFNPHKGEGCSMDEIGLWVQEALDLLDFAKGDESTAWGRIRSAMGHPAPFGLKYIAIGNEEIGEGFFERYPYFHEAIREKYPDVKIINSAGPFAVGQGNEAGWHSAKKYGSDLVDEHYYSNPEWFLANMHHYDDYDELGPGVFLGEYASWGNTYYNAIVEAAYMTHLEKAPAVKLACYAPLFCNVAYKNWTPDMIFFDGADMLLTANYHVQKMFMENQGDRELAITTEGLDETIELFDNDGIYGGFTIQGNDIKGKISNLTITDDVTGNCLAKKEALDITDKSEVEIGQINANKYTIEFEFDRSEGRKGLNLRLGKRNGESFLLWEFGGWDNWDCNIAYFVNGKASTISHNIFHVEDIHYQLKIQVEGRNLKTFVNGKLWNNVLLPQPEIEELYTCASLDKEGHTILKCVNLTGEDKEVEIGLADSAYNYESVTITELCDQGLTDENTFENPDLVRPKTRSEFVNKNRLTAKIKKHSVAIFKFNE